MIQTKRLTLRKPRPTDALDVFVIHGDPRTNQYNPAGPDTSIDVSQGRLDGWLKNWEEDGIGYFVVENMGLTVGFAGVRHADAADWGEKAEPVLNLYYRFAPEAQGHGFAGEAVRAVLDYAAEQRPDRPVVVITKPTNMPSIGLAKHLGFEFTRFIEYDGPSVEYRR